jgi:8-oxo-dGTP diphosphatase
VKPVIRVTAGIIIKKRRVLLAKRAKFSHLGGLWEFPGGKIEAGENPAECLKRELAEELRIQIDPRTVIPFDVSFYEYGSKRVFLIGMTVSGYSGRIEPVEHSEIKWMEIGKLETVALAPADVAFARRLERYF